LFIIPNSKVFEVVVGIDVVEIIPFSPTICDGIEVKTKALPSI
jgi:hypothetical protein